MGVSRKARALKRQRQYHQLIYKAGRRLAKDDPTVAVAILHRPALATFWLKGDELEAYSYPLRQTAQALLAQGIRGEIGEDRTLWEGDL
jgi:hypothetical protein